MVAANQGPLAGRSAGRDLEKHVVEGRLMFARYCVRSRRDGWVVVDRHPPADTFLVEEIVAWWPGYDEAMAHAVALTGMAR